MKRETRAQLRTAKRKVHQRARAAQRKAKGQDTTPLYWIWEFSKKVVLITAALYFVSFVYAMVMGYKSMMLIADATALSTLIAEANETFRVVVGGYMVKAGVENAAKIITGNMQKEKQTQPEGEPQDGIVGLNPDE